MAEGLLKRTRKVPTRYERDYYPSGMVESDSDMESDYHEETHEQSTLEADDMVDEASELPEGQFRVERLIAKRTKRSTTEYLTLWKGWPREASQWVKEDDISSALIRNFDHPQPQEHLIREAVGEFTHSIDRSLRKKCTHDTTIRLSFRHDIFHYLFKDKDKNNLQLHDFNSNYFPYGWNQWYRKYGDLDNASYCGRAIVFPIRIECYLQWIRQTGFMKLTDGTVQPKPKTFTEMIRVYICKVNISM